MSAPPREIAAEFWAALYDRDWPRIRSFFGALPRSSPIVSTSHSAM